MTQQAERTRRAQVTQPSSPYYGWEGEVVRAGRNGYTLRFTDGGGRPFERWFNRFGECRLVEEGDR